MIICAALQLKEHPEIVIGCWRHGFGYSNLHALGAEVGMSKITEGFLDSSGNFLNREDAFLHAINCGQLSASLRELKKERHENELYSEDLY